VLPAHPEEGVAQVRGELLADPKDALPGLPECRGEPVHRRHQLTPLRRQAVMLAEIVVQQVDDEQQAVRRLHRSPRSRRTAKLTCRAACSGWCRAKTRMAARSGAAPGSARPHSHITPNSPKLRAPAGEVRRPRAVRRKTSTPTPTPIPIPLGPT